MDDNDIPAVVRAMLSSISPGAAGMDAIGTLREEALHFSSTTEPLGINS